MIDVPEDPSDLLIAMVNDLRALLAGSPPSVAAATLSEAAAELVGSGPTEAWMMDAGHTASRGVVATAAEAMPLRELDAGAVRTALAAIQILDEWHAPLCHDLSGEQKMAGENHIDADLRLRRFGRFNRDPAQGSLIPRAGPQWRTSPECDLRDAILREYDGSRPDVGIGAYLRHTVVLPPDVEASADGTGGDARRVRVAYVPLSEGVAAARRDSPHRVLVAPMLEREEDVAVRRRQDGAAYLVTPSELVGRARAVVSRAYEEEASLILMPEMVLTPRALAAFRQELLDRHSEHSERTNRLPPLSYALVGVVEEVEDGAARRNYVVVLDGTGEVLASQDKLSRWNLRPDEQQQYELAPVDAAVPDLLLEPISPAEEVVVVDLPGLGRLVVLICADMDVSEPGDWLYANAGLEWVYAPIMDRTRRPVRARGRVGPWIVRRAHRAACATRGRVIVTNSMALTPVVNRSNERRGLSADYPPSVECDVGLLIDGRDQEVTCEPVVVALGTADVAEVRDWNVGWQTFLE